MNILYLIQLFYLFNLGGLTLNYKKFFWAFLCLIIGYLFQILIPAKGIYDILPNSLGYWLIYIGAKQLAKKGNKHFALTYKLSFSLIFISLFNLYKGGTNLKTIYDYIFAIITIIGIIISIITIYNLIIGIIDEAERRRRMEILNNAGNLFRFYIFSQFIYLVLVIVPFIKTVISPAITTPLYTLILVTNLAMMNFMKTCHNSLE